MRARLTADQFHLAMYGLIYPAVLGAILYGFFDELMKAHDKGPRPLALLTLAVFVLLFALDSSTRTARK